MKGNGLVKMLWLYILVLAGLLYFFMNRKAVTVVGKSLGSTSRTSQG